MMWLVRLALRRPISVAVMALLMLVLGTLSFFLMNIDIFPAINVPVVMVVWNYPGMASLDMERRMVFISERAYSTTVNGIEHIESESMLGVGLLKVYFQPGADIASAIAQINAVSETILSNMARGTEPPQIISYNAADVPVAQLNVSSDTKSVSQLFDYAFNFMRLQLFTIPGFSSPGWCDPSRDGEYRSDRVVRQQRISQRPRYIARHLQCDHSVWHRAHGPFRVQRRHQHEPDQGC
jgi:multidrug efflux pump subunit AcrB